MLITSKFTKLFDSNQLTDLKYNQLVEFAVQLRDIKNEISEIVNNNLLHYINIGKFAFISEMRQQFPQRISSYFEEALYTQVYTCYQNRFETIKKKITFKKRIFKEFQLYKRNSKNHNVGDLKKIAYENKSTDLSICLTYLARYGNENILNYIINEAYKKADKDKKLFYDNIIRCCNKFGFEKLYKIALLKRNLVFNRYKNAILFESLTFSGKTTCIDSIVNYNKNKQSKIKGFVSINVPFRKGLDIPVKLCDVYHGNLNEYLKDKNKKSLYCYTIKINEVKKNISVLLCKDGLRYLPENKTNFIGIDINVKHNLFALSDGNTYDFDRKLVNDYIKELNKIDKLKKLNKEYQPGKRRQIKLKAFQRKIKLSNLELIVKVCKDLLKKNIDHIVLENLDNSFKRSYVKNDEYDEKYNRLNHILNIGSLKDEFKHIAVNYDMSVSFVQSEYTSLLCSECWTIDSENREVQEEFECVECNCKMNADIHAAKNIKERVSKTVFRTSLLNKQKDGTYLPKKLTHELVCKKIHQIVMQLYNSMLRVI